MNASARDPRLDPVPGDTFEFRSREKTYRLEVLHARAMRLAGRNDPFIRARVRLTWVDQTGQSIGLPREFDTMSTALWRRMTKHARVVSMGMKP